MNRKIAVIGLGYVGLPVAVAFGKNDHVIGFDKNSKRIAELKSGFDKTGEISAAELAEAHILYTDKPEELKKADFFIVAVPTPIDSANVPDLTLLKLASEMISPHLKKGDIVVYESTVYPGVTETICLPCLAKHTNLVPGKDFKVGYSPERINPGDKEHSFTNILKIVSGQDAETLQIIAEVYRSVVKAGVYCAESIAVAEAAKVIENTQRDINIALMNELAQIFRLMNIDTHAVLKAASTKWNFVSFKPGLVGGHCIGVDPYYLTYRAQQLGHHPEVILSGRRINDSMGKYVADHSILRLFRHTQGIMKPIATILGLTFKENCPDIRNSKVFDIITRLQEYGMEIQLHDPHADPKEVNQHYGFETVPFDQLKPAHLVVVAVAHAAFSALPSETYVRLFVSTGGVLSDVKGILSEKIQDKRIQWWRL